MVKEPRISVAMASYNGARYIGEQLDSILEQLGADDELIISDDGSSDGTMDILRKYQEKDGRVKVIRGPGKGIKKNVEHAVRNAEGRYIFLADQDDIWMEGKVEKVMKAFAETGSGVVIHDAKVFRGENKSEIVMESFYAFRRSGPGVLKNILKNSYIGCCMAFRKELKEMILPIPQAIEMHDQWIGILSDFRYGKSCFLDETLLLYRRHGENNSAMTHYGISRMLRNRTVFLWHFCRRILKIS